MEVILWVGGILLLLWILFQINKIGIIEEKIGVIVAKLDKLEKLDNLDFSEKLDDIIELLPKSTKSQINKIGIIEEKIGIIGAKLDNMDFSDKLDDIIELLPKPTKSQIPENLYILKIDGITTDSILLTDIPKFLVDTKNTYVWDNEKLIWKHILLFDEIVSFCQIVTQYPLNWNSINLDVDKFRNGEVIPEAKTDEAWELAGKNGTPVWCYYNNDLDNGFMYGKLYNYHAVNDPRGLAPVGWHIPTDEEWTELENLLGKEAGKKLKSKNGWKNSGNCTDLVGFKALPGGFRYLNGSFYGIRDTASFWSATELDSTDAWTRFLNYDSGDVDRDISNKSLGASVRCLRD
jgi:uncharacterized protein (TIGR02145 family)